MKRKFFILTTIPVSLNFFRGQLNYLSNYFDITAISSQQDKLNEIGERENVKTHFIPMERSISLIKDVKSLFKLFFYFIKEKPYIVHGNTPKASFLSMIAAKLANVPIRIYMCHGLRYQGYDGVMKRFLMFMEKISCICSTEVICVSHGVKKRLIVDNICLPNKLKVIKDGSANGIDLTHFSKEKIVNNIYQNKNDFTFCFVGRLVKDKGINELVSAFCNLLKEYSDIRLLLVGPMENCKNAILESTKSLIENNSKINYVGRQSDVRPFMAQSDVFVLPSYREGFGMVLIEAGALGIPSITTDITGCNEIIQDGKNGKIVQSRNEIVLYDMMKWFYQHRNDEVKEMANNSSAMVRKRYEQSSVWKAYLNEYLSLLNPTGTKNVSIQK